MSRFGCLVWIAVIIFVVLVIAFIRATAPPVVDLAGHTGWYINQEGKRVLVVDPTPAPPVVVVPAPVVNPAPAPAQPPVPAPAPQPGAASTLASLGLNGRVSASGNFITKDCGGGEQNCLRYETPDIGGGGWFTIVNNTNCRFDGYRIDGQTGVSPGTHKVQAVNLRKC